MVVVVLFITSVVFSFNVSMPLWVLAVTSASMHLPATLASSNFSVAWSPSLAAASLTTTRASFNMTLASSNFSLAFSPSLAAESLTVTRASFSLTLAVSAKHRVASAILSLASTSDSFRVSLASFIRSPISSTLVESLGRVSSV